jgi:adenylosuccinate lyase
MELYESACPIDARYYGGDKAFFNRLKPYVAEEASIRYMARVELALVENLAEWGICPPSVPEEVRRAIAEITAREVYEEEARVGHNIRALVNCIKRKVSQQAGTWIHLFATSADITDTAGALRLKELSQSVLIPDLLSLHRVLADLARRHASTPQIGRTHGMFAEPVTFGFALALYVSRLGGRIKHIHSASGELRGMFSGAVGAHNALSIGVDDPTKFENDLLARLGLKANDTNISSQIAEPEPVADLAYGVVSCFSVLANLVDDIRHLHRSEIGEVKEGYSKDQVGSSTMPHKVNPKTFENIKSLWKEFMPRMVTVFIDQISEHQRDLTNSASGRFVYELMTAFAYAVHRLTSALSGLGVSEEAMRANLERSKGEIVAEPLYVMLACGGHPDAYDYSRSLVKRSRAEGRPILELLKGDPAAKPYLDNLTSHQQAVLVDAANYVGDAVSRTEATCDHWEGVLASIEEELGG